MPRPDSQKQFLRVETPVTTDGVTLAYDENQKPQYRITMLPLTARKEIERNDSKLPVHLRSKITVIANVETQAQAPLKQTKS